MSEYLNFSPSNIWAQTTPLNACKTLSIILALHMIQVGLWVFYDPHSCVKSFGLRFDGKPYHSNNAQSASNKLKNKAQTAKDDEIPQDGNFWTLLFAPREVGFGLLVLIFAYLGEWRSVGIVVAMVAGLLATTDGVATGLYGKDGWSGAATGHGVPAVILGGVAGGLLFL